MERDEMRKNEKGRDKAIKNETRQEMTGGKKRKTTTAQERMRRTEKDFDKTIKNETKRERTR